MPINYLSKHFNVIIGVFASAVLILLPIMIYAILNSPRDYLQDDLVKIMYIHVPSAWLGLGIYSSITFLSAIFIIFKNPQYFIIARHLAIIGACYTTIALITGSIWGKPAWGTWWVWDARLTSMLLLLFIYIGYYSLSHSNAKGSGMAEIASYYAIVSFIIIPIIKFSVDIWSTLHQPSSVLRLDGPTIHYEMLTNLALALIFHVIFACLILCIAIQTDIMARKNSR